VNRPPVVFAVTDDRVVQRPGFLERAGAIAAGADVAIVLRARMTGAALLDLADRLRAITARSGTRLLVHDRLDVARLAGADGVHLPATGFPVRAIRDDPGPGMLVGRSTHTPETAALALGDGADYVFLGNIWETETHPGRAPLGPAAIRAAVHAAETAHGSPSTRPPVIAIGGVTPERAREARDHGAGGAAAVRALWDAPDAAAAVRAFLLSFDR
jgi:thiamine-phosphate diphosphorylase